VTPLDNIDKILLTIAIHDKIVDTSISLDEQLKQGLKHISKSIGDFLTATPNANSYQRRMLTNELLTYWNNSINPDTENFWTALRTNDIDFERKEPLRFALSKKRFRNVEQGIDARNHWIILKTSSSIIDRFSKTEIQQIDNIISDDEKKRLDVLQKCLVKGAIPQTQYLKFGECMAYFDRCKLFDTYFSKQQVHELYNIWSNFKST
jgi:hypothetical protein